MNENQRRIANAPIADNEVYVGPGWIREGKHLNQPMRDGDERRKLLTEQDIIARAELRASRRFLLTVCVVFFLIAAVGIVAIGKRLHWW